MQEWWSQSDTLAPLGLRTRAALALWAYRRAERRYQEIQQRKDELEARERAFVLEWSSAVTAQVQPEDHHAIQLEYLALSERRIKLQKNWQEANLAVTLAYDRAQQLLQEIGFKSAVDA
ncbi:hypothetical protein KXS15_24400 [Sinorhizobium meliloti]|uniref:hypothetical protein n=1 Tax=Rhizobium meliloti TaxID=382 RepID=UPI003F18184D